MYRCKGNYIYTSTLGYGVAASRNGNSRIGAFKGESVRVLEGRNKEHIKGQRRQPPPLPLTLVQFLI